MNIVRVVFLMLLPTRLKVVLTVEGNRHSIIDKCEQVLADMGELIAHSNGSGNNQGVMIARIGRNWPFAPDQLTVQIEQQDGRYYLMHITSETSLFVALRDWKRNARNIDRFIDHVGLG